MIIYHSLKRQIYLQTADADQFFCSMPLPNAAQYSQQ